MPLTIFPLPAITCERCSQYPASFLLDSTVVRAPQPICTFCCELLQREENVPVAPDAPTAKSVVFHF